LSIIDILLYGQALYPQCTGSRPTKIQEEYRDHGQYID